MVLLLLFRPLSLTTTPLALVLPNYYPSPRLSHIFFLSLSLQSFLYLCLRGSFSVYVIFLYRSALSLSLPFLSLFSLSLPFLYLPLLLSVSLMSLSTTQPCILCILLFHPVLMLIRTVTFPESQTY